MVLCTLLVAGMSPRLWRVSQRSVCSVRLKGWARGPAQLQHWLARGAGSRRPSASDPRRLAQPTRRCLASCPAGRPEADCALPGPAGRGGACAGPAARRAARRRARGRHGHQRLPGRRQDHAAVPFARRGPRRARGARRQQRQAQQRRRRGGQAAQVRLLGVGGSRAAARGRRDVRPSAQADGVAKAPWAATSVCVCVRACLCGTRRFGVVVNDMAAVNIDGILLHDTSASTHALEHMVATNANAAAAVGSSGAHGDGGEAPLNVSAAARRAALARGEGGGAVVLCARVGFRRAGRRTLGMVGGAGAGAMWCAACRAGHGRRALGMRTVSPDVMVSGVLRRRARRRWGASATTPPCRARRPAAARRRSWTPWTTWWSCPTGASAAGSRETCCWCATARMGGPGGLRSANETAPPAPWPPR